MNWFIIRICIIIHMIIGISMVVISLIVKNSNKKRKLRCTGTTIGIFDHAQEMGMANSDGYRNYYSIYKYTINNNDYYCHGNKGSFYEKDVPKDNVTIFYNPDNPEESIVYNTGKGSTIVLIVGIIITSISLLLLLFKLLLRI